MRSVEDACGDGLSDKMLCACERYRCTYIEREVLTFYIHIDGQRQNQIQKQKQREIERETENPQESQFKPQGGDQKHPEQSTQG